MLDHHQKIEASYALLKTFQEPVILLHPHSRYRSLLLARMMNDPAMRCFYYALDPDDISVACLVESMTRSLSNQYPLFGRYLNLQPEEVFKSFGAHEELVMHTFARELAALSDAPYYFLLDEYDRSDDADDIHRFVELLAEYLPPQCRLVLNGRTMPRLPWIALVAKRRAAILLDDARVERDFYSRPPQPQPYLIEATTFGPGHVYVNGDVIEGWEGHLPRLLLFFALDRPVVTRSEICYSFWPTLETEQAVNVFHVTKRRLHKALGYDVLVHSETHYCVNPSLSVYYDAFEFVEALMEGRHSAAADAIEAWRRAVALYTGPFLYGHDEKWVLERRSAYRVGYIEALMQMADFWIGRERFEMAIRQYEQAIAEAYYEELPHQRLLSLYVRLGRRSEAVAHFQKLEQAYRSANVALSPAMSHQYAALIS